MTRYDTQRYLHARMQTRTMALNNTPPPPAPPTHTPHTVTVRYVASVYENQRCGLITGWEPTQLPDRYPFTDVESSEGYVVAHMTSCFFIAVCVCVCGGGGVC
jgi:hypothetical protein